MGRKKIIMVDFNLLPLLCSNEGTPASFLENECYKKYGKSGKTFCYSQVASAVRWLLTATACGI
jgi:hypothetical protein